MRVCSDARRRGRRRKRKRKRKRRRDLIHIPDQRPAHYRLVGHSETGRVSETDLRIQTTRPFNARQTLTDTAGGGSRSDGWLVVVEYLICWFVVALHPSHI